MAHRTGRFLSLLCLFAAATAVPAAAQARDDLGRVKGVFPGAGGDRIVQMIEAGRRDGLPVSLLVSKVLEGAQKGVPPDDVLKALDAYVRELREARKLVGRGVEDEALKEAADALRRGVPPATVRDLARRYPDDLSLLLVVTFDLVDQGVAPGRASEFVREAAGMGYRGDRLLGLSGAVRGLIRGGMAPAVAVDSVRRSLRKGNGSASISSGARGSGRVPSRSGHVRAAHHRPVGVRL